MSGPPLNILLVGDYPDDPRLGSSKVFHKLQEEFVALGHTCDIIWTVDIGARPAWRQVRQFASPWMAGKAISRQMARRKYDVVDAASAEGLWLGLRALVSDRDRAAYVCRSNGLEHLNYARMLDDHDEGLRRKSWMRRIWYPVSRLSQVAAAARLADGLVLLNDVDRTFALENRWQPPDRVTVVPHGISGQFLADAPPSDSPRGAGLLFCGTWDHVKGIAYLCDATNRLHAMGSQVPLTVLGPGVDRETVLQRFDPAVRPFVTVIDRVSEDRVLAEYRRHDALLWTSTYEGFGLVLLEAMSQRLPVIATPAGCAATLVRDGETGYLIPPRNAGALMSAIGRLMANPSEARRLADNGCAAAARMTWRSTAEQTLTVYRAAVARVRAAPMVRTVAVTRPRLSILLVGDYPDDSRLGSSKVFYKLREEFERLGHTCDVLWASDIGAWPASRQVRQLLSPWMAGRAIVRRMARRKYDVVDAASAEGLSLGLTRVIRGRDRAAFVCRSNGLEHLNYARMIDDHVDGLRRKPWTRRIWYPASRLSQVAAAARSADGLLLLNEMDAKFALDRGWQPPGRVSVVPHGISERFLTAAPPTDAARGGGLLFCGTWDHMKGIAYLVGAVNRLHAMGERVRLTVLGPGVPSQRVLDAFDDAVRPFVTVIDRVAEDRVMAEYRRHDALVWTSTYEGFGLVLLEAMSQRLPVISTAVGCAATLVRDGETGYRIPPRDVGALVSAIIRVRKDPSEARRLADNGCAAVAKMTWRSTAEQTLAVYCAAIDRVHA